MKRIETCCKLAMLLFLALWFNITLGGGESSNQKSSTTPGSYKTRKIAGSPLYSAKFRKPAKGDPVDMAYEFFELNRERLGIENPREELKPTYKAFDSIGGVISFQQFYQGVPIQYTEIDVRFAESGELKSVEGDYHYDVNLPTTPSIDSVSAVEIALKEAGPAPFPKGVCSSKPIIIPSSELFRYKENRLYMVWPVRVYPDSTEKARIGYFKKYYRYYIDALDGSVLQKGEDSDVKREPLKPSELEKLEKK